MLEKGSTIARSYLGVPRSAPRTVLITGGSAMKDTARKLTDFNRNVSYVISTTGNEGPLRGLFQEIPGLTSFINRMNDVASRDTDDHIAINALLRYELGKRPEYSSVSSELAPIINGGNDLCDALKTVDKRNCLPLIKFNLSIFQDGMKQQIEATRNGLNPSGISVGDIFLAGSYIKQGDFVASLKEYRYLTEGMAEVLPASREAVHLIARMPDKKILAGEKSIVNNNFGRPERMWFAKYLTNSDNRFVPEISRQAQDAIKNAKLIIYSMGRFYTSIIACLLVKGFAQAIRQSTAQKLFISNPTHQSETRGLDAGDMGRIIIDMLKANDPEVGSNKDYMTHMLVCGQRSREAIMRSSGNAVQKGTAPEDVKLIEEEIASEMNPLEYDPLKIISTMFYLSEEKENKQ